MAGKTNFRRFRDGRAPRTTRTGGRGGRFVLLALAAAFACADGERVTAPAGAPRFAISDGRSGGTTGFYFLPPLVAPPKATGTFDPALQPEISVCALTGLTCGPEVAHFTMTSSPAVTLDLAGEAYALIWQPKNGPLVAGSRYRLQVSIGALALGYLDLAVVSKAGELKSVPQGDIGVVAGSPINVRFRIETGILSSLTMTPAASLLGIDGTQALTLQATDLHGATVAVSGPVAWSSSSPAVTVSSAGVATGVTPGEATVTAEVWGVKATAKVEVVPDLMFVLGSQGADPEFLLLRLGAPPAHVKTVTGGVLVEGFSWSPDGTRIAYSTFPGGLTQAPEIRTMNADGSGEVQLTPSDDGRSALFPSWSRDGSLIAFSSRVDPSNTLQQSEIWAMDPDGGNPHVLRANPYVSLNFPAWSPDGAHIAHSFIFDVDVTDADGSDMTTLATLPLPGLLERPSWSPDSKTLVVSGCPDPACGLYFVDVAARTLASFLAGESDGVTTTNLRNPDWSPDGRRIAYVRWVKQGSTNQFSIEMARPDGTDRVTLWDGTTTSYVSDLAWRPW
ncbi:MAG TPA: hypothetical protein VFQ38_12680 [Longimicrobiales bacterium]|nr:hypothetical protein [Longimicrobiales bacterium]